MWLDMGQLFESMRNVSSRPSSSSSTRPGTSNFLGGGLTPRAGSAGKLDSARHARNTVQTSLYGPSNVGLMSKVPPLPVFSPRLEVPNELRGTSSAGYLGSYLANKGRSMITGRSTEEENDNEDEDNYSDYGL